jgi:prevent-host-death family protein
MYMTTTMPISKARVNLGAVVKRVLKGERITLEKGGIPIVTIISREDLEDLEDGIALMIAREEQKGEKGVPLKKALKRYGL